MPPLSFSETGANFESSPVTMVSFNAEYQTVRKGFETFIGEIQQTGLLSNEQIQSQRRWIESIVHDPASIQEAKAAYVGLQAEKAVEEAKKLYEKEFIDPLDEAMEMGAISAKSYKEWLKWIHDPQRDSATKKSSIKEYLPKYLDLRRALAEDRFNLRKDKRLKDDAVLKNPSLREKVDALGDDRIYFELLDLNQRRNLIDSLSAQLEAVKGGEQHKKLYAEAENMLIDATKEPQPALHRDKVGTWLKRIFEGGYSLEEMEKFVHGNGTNQLQDLIKTWRSVAIRFWRTRMDPAFDGVKIDFINTKAFLAMHYEERMQYVRMMEYRKSQALRLRSMAMSNIERAAFALGPGAKERWLKAYVFNDNLTLEELTSIISGEMTRRLDEKVKILDRYQRAVGEGTKHQAFRGKQIISKSAFLALHFDRQVKEVQDLEARMSDMRNSKPNFLQIRHYMDRGDWEVAQDLINEEKKGWDAMPQEDKSMLRVLEQKVHEHIENKQDSHTVEGRTEKLTQLYGKVDGLLESLPGNMQGMGINMANRGAMAMGALSWTSYNREWCWDRGYLNYKREKYAIERGKTQALEKNRMKNPRAVYNQTLLGKTGDEEYIDLSRTGPTNVCVDLTDGGAVSAYCQSMYHNRNDARKLYWTNAIFHENGNPMPIGAQRTATKKMYDMRNALRQIESLGGIYQYKFSSQAMADPERN